MSPNAKAQPTPDETEIIIEGFLNDAGRVGMDAASANMFFQEVF